MALVIVSRADWVMRKMRTECVRKMNGLFETVKEK